VPPFEWVEAQPPKVAIANATAISQSLVIVVSRLVNVRVVYCRADLVRRLSREA